MFLDGTTSVEFYKTGFFGYGEKGDFKLYSFWHFLPIIILVLAIILTYIFREKIRNCKHESTIRFIIGVFLLIIEMSYYWRLIYVGAEGKNDNLLTRLPFQVCEWTCIFASLLMLTGNKHLFDIDCVVCLTIGIFPLFIPSVIQYTGPLYYRYYQFWFEHIGPIYAVFYMIFVKEYKYEFKNVYKAYIFLTILAVISIILNNNIPNAGYLYLTNGSIGTSFENILPTNQYLRTLVYALIVTFIFIIEALVFYLIRKKKHIIIVDNNKDIVENEKR